MRVRGAQAHGSRTLKSTRLLPVFAPRSAKGAEPRGLGNGIRRRRRREGGARGAGRGEWRVAGFFPGETRLGLGLEQRRSWGWMEVEQGQVNREKLGGLLLWAGLS